MSRVSAVALAPLGALYGAITRARLMLYHAGALRVHKIDAPVISVGNITTGGTGKTPLVEWIARAVAREGRRCCILTRGYGRANPRSRVIVSDGERILADARTGGDEPRLLAERLQGIAAIISDANRAQAARWALENLGSQAFILDDGFQHLSIARDLNIVTVDATNPWGGSRILPRGRLREPLRGLARADLIVLTRAEQAQDLSSLKKEAERLSGNRPMLLARTRTCGVRSLNGTDSDDLSGARSSSKPVAAFCAIGNPQSFFAHIRNEGHALRHARAFPDHHVYTQTQVDAIEREAEAFGAEALLTTAKDAVKLRAMRFRLPCYTLEVEMEFDDEGKLLDLIRGAIMM
jgi:tetraacyldisaccharide 4'-kinase